MCSQGHLERAPICFGRAPIPEEDKLANLTHRGDHSRDSTRPLGIESRRGSWVSPSRCWLGTPAGLFFVSRTCSRSSTASFSKH